MRTWALPLLALAVSFAANSQETATPNDAAFLKNLRIPVELRKGIKVERVRAGDAVQLRMVEPVLAGKGIVVPGNAKLIGRVLNARPAQDDKPSLLAIVVEKAVWKGGSIPLNAYVAGWGTRVIEFIRPCGAGNMPGRIRGGRRANPLGDSMSDSEFSGCTSGQSERVRVRVGHANTTSGIDIYRSATDGSTLLVSKKNIHLSGGLILILQNTGRVEMIANRAE